MLRKNFTKPLAVLWPTCWQWGKRGILIIIAIWFSTIVLFSFLPVPFSAVMAERQINAWLHGNFHYHIRFDWVKMNDISPHMALAVIAAEDQRFTSHWGIDWISVKQALDGSDIQSKPLRGASTLSQQTSKNLLLWDGRSWLRKGLEASLTTILELVWSKKRILTVYLNIVEFGDGIFGVEAASQHFFNKPAKDLNATQAARLASVLPNPHRFKANAPSAYILARQQWILQQMKQLGGVAFLDANHLHK